MTNGRLSGVGAEVARNPLTTRQSFVDAGGFGASPSAIRCPTYLGYASTRTASRPCISATLGALGARAAGGFGAASTVFRGLASRGWGFAGLRREGEQRSPAARSLQGFSRSRTRRYVEEKDPRATTRRASSCRRQQKDPQDPSLGCRPTSPTLCGGLARCMLGHGPSGGVKPVPARCSTARVRWPHR